MLIIVNVNYSIITENNTQKTHVYEQHTLSQEKF